MSPLLAQLNAFLNGHSAAICSTASSKSSLLRRSDAILPSASGEDAFRTSFNWYPAFDPLSIFYCRTQYPALNRASQFATACMSLCRDSTKSGTTRHRLVSRARFNRPQLGNWTRWRISAFLPFQSSTYAGDITLEHALPRDACFAFPSSPESRGRHYVFSLLK